MQNGDVVQVRRPADLQLLAAKRVDEAGAVGGEPQLSDLHRRELVEDEADAAAGLICGSEQKPCTRSVSSRQATPCPNMPAGKP